MNYLVTSKTPKSTIQEYESILSFAENLRDSIENNSYQTRKDKKKDKEILLETMQLLRESFSLYRDECSILKTAELKIRLSRFDLSKPPQFEFLRASSFFLLLAIITFTGLIILYSNLLFEIDFLISK